MSRRPKKTEACQGMMLTVNLAQEGQKRVGDGIQWRWSVPPMKPTRLSGHKMKRSDSKYSGGDVQGRDWRLPRGARLCLRSVGRHLDQ